MYRDEIHKSEKKNGSRGRRKNRGGTKKRREYHSKEPVYHYHKWEHQEGKKALTVDKEFGMGTGGCHLVRKRSFFEKVCLQLRD